jgi:uncharacterized membrane protein YbaN (DUF454 family)
MIRQKLFLLLGCTSLGLGFAGVFLPFLPTTPFVLLSAFCFSRSSARLHQWLLEHPAFGALLLDWQRGGVIRPRAKTWSILLMNGFIGYAVIFRATSLPVKVLLVLITVGVTIFIVSRPSVPRPEQVARPDPETGIQSISPGNQGTMRET